MEIYSLMNIVGIWG